MILTYYKRTVYGREEAILIGDGADAVKTLTKRKTLTQEDGEALQKLGHTLEEVSFPTPQ